MIRPILRFLQLTVALAGAMIAVFIFGTTAFFALGIGRVLTATGEAALGAGRWLIDHLARWAAPHSPEPSADAEETAALSPPHLRPQADTEANPS